MRFEVANTYWVTLPGNKRCLGVRSVGSFDLIHSFGTKLSMIFAEMNRSHFLSQTKLEILGSESPFPLVRRGFRPSNVLAFSLCNAANASGVRSANALCRRLTSKFWAGQSSFLCPWRITNIRCFRNRRRQESDSELWRIERAIRSEPLAASASE